MPREAARTTQKRLVKEEVAILKRVPLFSTATSQQLRRILDECTFRSVQPGTVLTRQGERGRELFVVLNGNADCTVDGVKVREFGSGSFFGELTVLLGGPRTATITATSPMNLLVLDRSDVNALLYESPEIARRMLLALATKLRDDAAQLTQ
jgi:CRP-like cAMP-binding protein